MCGSHSLYVFMYRGEDAPALVEALPVADSVYTVNNTTLRDMALAGPLYLPADPSPLVVMELTSVAKLHFMFTMLGMTHIYVVSPGGVLIGVVTKKDLIDLRL